MYEVGMSANSRVEPVFEPEIRQWEGEPPVSLGAEHLIYEEEAYNGFSGLLLKSGLVILLVISAYGGYQVLGNDNADQQLVSAKLLSASENKTLNVQDKTIRKIDLTTTASIKEPVEVTGKSVPIATKPKSEDKLFHVVEAGDTLSAIGRKFKIKTSELMALNAIEDARRIKPGMKLIVSK